LRPVSRSDLDYFLVLLNDEKVTLALTAQSPITLKEELEWYNNLNENQKVQNPEERDYVFTIIAHYGPRAGMPIGNCNLRGVREHDKNGFFGIMIDKEYWGNGYGTEASILLINYGFLNLGLHKVTSSVLCVTPNYGWKLHKKLGFEEEGRFREARFKRGKWVDEVIFGLLRKRWEKLGQYKAGVV